MDTADSLLKGSSTRDLRDRNGNGSLENSGNYSSSYNSKNNLRSGSTTSLASDSELRNAASATTTTDSGEIDYKKLCKQLLRENEVLRREKRALQRTISEQEEELKSLGDVKADNVRLKDENGALIRVISKLSK